MDNRGINDEQQKLLLVEKERSTTRFLPREQWEGRKPTSRLFCFLFSLTSLKGIRHWVEGGRHDEHLVMVLSINDNALLERGLVDLVPYFG
jgi:hypothetical protein